MEITCGRKVEKIWWRGDSGRGGGDKQFVKYWSEVPPGGKPLFSYLEKVIDENNEFDSDPTRFLVLKLCGTSICSDCFRANMNLLANMFGCFSMKILEMDSL